MNYQLEIRNLYKLLKLTTLITFTLLIIGLLYPDFPLAQPSLNTSTFNPQGILINALQWIDDLGTIGGIAFIGIYITATIPFLPGSILTLGAGVVFGIVWGSIYVFIGATLGATAAFFVGRSVTRG